eukprot:GHVS01048039.1.p1 GENE.GHVS01048039.1~~GHVS01048039.1.p1  ORF type:complete len:572 (-),score=45.65 GHVS01048039.1:140-1783(-)
MLEPFHKNLSQVIHQCKEVKVSDKDSSKLDLRLEGAPERLNHEPKLVRIQGGATLNLDYVSSTLKVTFLEDETSGFLKYSGFQKPDVDAILKKLANPRPQVAQFIARKQLFGQDIKSEDCRRTSRPKIVLAVGEVVSVSIEADEIDPHHVSTNRPVKKQRWVNSDESDVWVATLDASTLAAVFTKDVYQRTEYLDCIEIPPAHELPMTTFEGHDDVLADLLRYQADKQNFVIEHNSMTLAVEGGNFIRGGRRSGKTHNDIPSTPHQWHHAENEKHLILGKEGQYFVVTFSRGDKKVWAFQEWHVATKYGEMVNMMVTGDSKSEKALRLSLIRFNHFPAKTSKKRTKSVCAMNRPIWSLVVADKNTTCWSLETNGHTEHICGPYKWSVISEKAVLHIIYKETTYAITFSNDDLRKMEFEYKQWTQEPAAVIASKILFSNAPAGLLKDFIDEYKTKTNGVFEARSGGVLRTVTITNHNAKPSCVVIAKDDITFELEADDIEFSSSTSDVEPHAAKVSYHATRRTSANAQSETLTWTRDTDPSKWQLSWW